MPDDIHVALVALAHTLVQQVGIGYVGVMHRTVSALNCGPMTGTVRSSARPTTLRRRARGANWGACWTTGANGCRAMRIGCSG